MPKLSALCWPVGIAVGLLLIAGVSLSWSGAHPMRMTSPFSAISAWFDGDEYGGELRELAFMHAAYQRIEAERRQARSNAVASLQTERDAVMQRVREVASRVPDDRIPADIRRLLDPEAAAASGPGSAPGIAQGAAPPARPEATPAIVPAAASGITPPPAARSIDAAATEGPTGELRVGRLPPAPGADFSSLALGARPPWPLFTGRKQPQPPASAADRADPRPQAR